MWYWIVTAVTASGGVFTIICLYRFARMKDAQKHLADNQENVWQMVQENDGIVMSDIEVVWEPKRQSRGQKNWRGPK